jgi:hypothetical protein
LRVVEPRLVRHGVTLPRLNPQANRVLR